MMSLFKAMMIVAACGLFAAGCGQKGDLFIPEADTANSTESADGEDDKENTE